MNISSCSEAPQRRFSSWWPRMMSSNVYMKRSEWSQTNSLKFLMLHTLQIDILVTLTVKIRKIGFHIDMSKSGRDDQLDVCRASFCLSNASSKSNMAIKIDLRTRISTASAPLPILTADYEATFKLIALLLKTIINVESLLIFWVCSFIWSRSDRTKLCANYMPWRGHVYPRQLHVSWRVCLRSGLNKRG